MIYFFSILTGLLALSGCQSLSLFSSPVQKRGISGFFKDNALRVKIIKNLMSIHTGSISYLINNGDVLLVGYVSTEKEHKDVLEKLSIIPDIVHLWDYLVVGKKPDDPINDTYISQTLQSKLFFDTRIRSQNYHINASDKTVYILGTAQSEQEKQYVLEHVDSMKVRRLVNKIDIAPS